MPELLWLLFVVLAGAMLFGVRPRPVALEAPEPLPLPPVRLVMVPMPVRPPVTFNRFAPMVNATTGEVECTTMAPMTFEPVLRYEPPSETRH